MTSKLSIFIDADVLFAGAASPSKHSASNVVLQMSELTLIEAVASEQVITEVERNLSEKLPSKLTTFQQLVNLCLRIVPDPVPEDLAPFRDQADPKDLPILVAALQAKCVYLLTFNTRHYFPKQDKIIVQRPGEFLRIVRNLLGGLP